MHLEQIKKILNIALPAALSNAVVIFAILMNTRTLGMINKQNLYWLALFMPLNYLFTAIFQTMATTALAITAVNKQQSQKLSELISALLLLTLLLFSALSLIIFTANTSQHIVHLPWGNNHHFSIFILTMTIVNFIVCCSIIMNAVLYALGNANLALILTIISSSISCLLTFQFAHYFQFNLYGLVVALLISYTASCLGSIYLLNKQGINVYHRLIKTKKEFLFTAYRYLRMLGIPVLLIYSVIFISLFFCNKILLPFGQDVVASFGIAFRIQNLIIIPSIAIGLAIGVLVNHYVALKNIPVANSYLRVGLIFTFIINVIIALLVYGFRMELSALITNNKTIQLLTENYLYYLSFSYIGLGPALAFLCILEQTGYGLKSLLLNLLVFSLQISIGGTLCRYYQDVTLFYKTGLVVNFAMLLLVIGELALNKKYQSRLSRLSFR